MPYSCLLSSAWVRLRTNAPLKLAGGSMILTGLRAGVAALWTMEGNGRSGREVGKEWLREGSGRGWAEAASGEDTRGREAMGLNGEGAAATVMTAGEREVRGRRETRRGHSLMAGGVGRGRTEREWVWMGRGAERGAACGLGRLLLCAGRRRAGGAAGQGRGRGRLGYM